MNGLLCVAAIAAFLVAPNLANYCQIKRCSPSTHSMCKYKKPTPAPACGPVSSTGFTEAEKTEIINKHNQLRQSVYAGKETRGNPGPQPAALKMNFLSWDDELAKIAQRWVNQCNFGNDECKDVDRFVVGQNLGMTMTTGEQHTKPSDILMSWYNKVVDMDRNLVNGVTTNNRAGEYTQMMWATTEKVGCGKIVYKPDKWNRYYMVCNYGPAGNWLGNPVYDAVRN